MQSPLRVTLAAFAILLLSSAPASATPTYTISLDAPSAIVSDGHSVGPYRFYANGIALDLVCDDFAHGVARGDTWDATMATIDDLSKVRFGGSDVVTRYSIAFLLAGALLTGPTSEYGEQHYALWPLFDPSAPLPPGGFRPPVLGGGQRAGGHL
jgi:hypothetical protein